MLTEDEQLLIDENSVTLVFKKRRNRMQIVALLLRISTFSKKD